MSRRFFLVFFRKKVVDDGFASVSAVRDNATSAFELKVHDQKQLADSRMIGSRRRHLLGDDLIDEDGRCGRVVSSPSEGEATKSIWVENGKAQTMDSGVDWMT